jgi:hypothetical protein
MLNENGKENKRKNRRIKNRKMKESKEDIPVCRKTGEIKGKRMETKNNIR